MQFSAAPAHSQRVSASTQARCLALLRETASSPTAPFFVRVHAAEALIFHGYPEGLEAPFAELRRASPDQFVGATRVLARLHRADPAKHAAAVGQLLDVFRHGESFRPRLVALESLAKLGYAEPLPDIEREAREGRDGMMGMARWVLANSGNADAEARLADLLDQPDPLAYRYAAYATRFLNTLRPATLARLDACAARLQPDDPARVYVLSARFVHTPAGQRPAARQALLGYATGAANERYEVAEALGIAGSAADVPQLEKLLADPDPDVRVAAAHALLRMGQ